MATHAIPAQIPAQISEAICIKLENQREPFKNRVGFSGCVKNRIGVRLKIKDLNPISLLAQSGSQITESQVLLLPEADQHHGPQCIPLCSIPFCRLQNIETHRL